MDIPVKPRVLIADDSKLVRATLIKHIEGMFEFREASDGEHAWETLLLDPNIRVVITDLTMPNLDGYGLLHRIRSSKISRIRNIPVMVVSGSEDEEDRERARAAGATDLITKGIATVQLLSRLELLSKLVNTQSEFERSLEALVQSGSATARTVVPSANQMLAQCESLLASALKNKKDFVLLSVRVAVKQAGQGGVPLSPPASLVEAIGVLLQNIVRQNDCVAKTGETEFILTAGSASFDTARLFAQRICHAIASANLLNEGRMTFIASCGLASLSGDCSIRADVTLPALWDVARRRAEAGLHHAVTGVVGAEEEAAFLKGA
jgi:two-component system cell cycle response regulator